MSLRVGLDFGTSNSGVAVRDGSQVRLLPVDPSNSVPEVVKSILYITKDHRAYIGQEAVELYYRHNVNRARRFVKKWAGEIDYHGAEMDYVTDVFVYVDELRRPAAPVHQNCPALGEIHRYGHLRALF